MARTTTVAFANYMAVNSSGTPLGMQLTEFSWSFWVTPAALAMYCPVGHDNSLSTYNRYIVFGPTGSISLLVDRAIASCQFTSIDGVLSANNWYHIVTIYSENNNPQIYVNGSEISYVARLLGSGTTRLADGSFEIGKFRNIASFSGSVTEFGYWNRRLTEAEITSLSNTSNPYSPILIPNGLIGYWRLYGNTGGPYEPDYINDQTLTIYGTVTSSSNPYVFDTRIEDTSSPQLLGSSDPSFQRGRILAQKVGLSSESVIDKASLYLNPVSDGFYDRIQVESGIAAWSALNFQKISDERAWTLYSSDLTEYNGQDDFSVGQGFLSNTNATNYTSADEIYLVSPTVSYDLLIPAGTYKVWVRADGSGDFWYSWNSDSTPDKLTLSSDLIWRSIGEIDVDEESNYTLYIYLGNSGEQAIKIDEFMLVEDSLSNTDLAGQHITYVETNGPYNVFTRVRDLNSEGDIQAASSSSIIGCGWLTSNKIKSSGWFNFGINNKTFSTGLSLEYIVISGDKKFNAQWNYSPSDAVTSYYSTDYGNSFTQDS